MNPYGPQMYGAPQGAQQRHCPACRADNPVSNMFCRGCGASLPEALALPVEHAAQGPAWGCQACRHENAAHYAFCLGCGAARGAGAPPQRMMGYEGNPGAAPGQRSPVVLILVLVIVVLVLIGGIGAGAAMFLVR